MPKNLEVGTERLMNGYIAIKQSDGSWEYQHRLVMEEKLGRPLEPNERVYFLDGDRTNLDPENLRIKWLSPTKKYRHRANLRRRIIEARARLEDLEQQLAALNATMEDGPIAKVQEGRGGRSYRPSEPSSSEV